MDNRFHAEGAGLITRCAAIFILVFALYWRTRSKWLDDWDSVQFALGVKQLNLFLHQPHPPGYPIYIFLGWLGTHGFGMEIPDALVLVGCLGAGVFVAAWFYMLASQFGQGLGWLAALTLAFVPMDWMTGTKALTDIPAAACIALELAVIAPWKSRSGIPAAYSRQTDLIADSISGKDAASTCRIILAALIGAIATGMRPQYIAIAPLILITGLWRARAGWRGWCMAAGVFVAGCLAWLIPTLWTQAVLPEAGGSWLTYPRQLLAQWRWRLDKPDVYLGAGDWSPLYLGKRIYRHTIKVWLLTGFGWHPRRILGALGLALYAGGALIYFWKKVYREESQRDFWRINFVWAAAYFILIFATLPSNMRYYCPFAPLLALPPLAGWWSLCGRWRWSAAALPCLLLITTGPLAALNHRKPAPPIRMLEYLNKKVPRKEQAKTWLFLTDSKRHAAWYAPDFKLVHVKDAPEPERILKEAHAIYTEDSQFIMKSGWRGVTLKKVRVFERSPVIHDKHVKCTLYKIVPSSI